MTDLIASNEIQTGSIYQQQTVDSIINNNNNNTNNKNNNSKNKFVIIIENELVSDIQFEEERYLHKKFKKIASSNDAGQENEDFHNTSLPKDVAIEAVDSEFDSSSTINLESFNELRKSGYICPYCKLSCAKPSVLQKHIRAHTNERPYPCMPCGFAFKTKSNLYKHCRSRAHVSKMEGANIKVQSEFSSSCLNTSLKRFQFSNSPEPSDDSDPSLSDTASTTSTNVPSPSTLNVIPSRIYKPKFHTVLQQCKTDVTSHHKKTTPNQTQQHIQFFIDDQNLIDTSNTQSQTLLHSHHGKSSMHHEAENESRKRTYREGSQSLVQEFQRNMQPISKYENHETTVPLASPGPLLGSTRLIDEPKRARFEVNVDSVNESIHQPRINALQMFGGEVRIIAASGEAKTMRVQTHQQKNKQMSTSFESNNAASILSSSLSKTASVLVQSGLQSGGTILQKQQANPAIFDDSLDFGRIPENVSITPLIETPKFAPTLEAAYPKPTNIVHAGRLIPYVPGIPGPQSLSPLPFEHEENNTLSLVGPIYASVSKIRKINTSDVISHDTISNKFLRPSTLPLKPGTFTPKRHHGITPTANTLVLISPETPRPKKSYGQLYLNGHAYTYLGLKCSTRLFYCTLNKPQPMYVLQQQGLSMYSNWKVCKETSPELELQYYDSRNRSHSYTLASTCNQDILTHSSQRSVTPTTPDSGLESDSPDKTKRVRIFDGGFESNEDYTYIRGRGRGRYVCEECGIRCKKPSMLKKHIRTHTDVRPYTCKYCAFSFKTKGNLTKHMKSKAHYKKCIELRVIPVPTSVCDENIDKEALKQLVLNGTSTEDTSSSDDESEADVEPDSDESSNEEHEAAQSLLRLATRTRSSHIAFTSKNSKVLGILTSSRPTAYPYGQSHMNETDCLADNIECSLSVHTPIDLTINKMPKYPTPKSNTTDILGSPVSGSKFLQTLFQTMKRLPIQNCNWQVAAVSQDQMFQAYLTERHLMNSKLKQHCRVAVPSIKPITSKIVAEIEHRKIFESESDHENSKLKSFEQLNLASMLSARKVVVNKMGLTASSPPKQSTEFFQPSLGQEAKNVCSVCSKVFSKPSQLRLHINIHYFERPFRCESCGTSFRTKGHLTKHERSTLHHNKVNMTSTFGAATASNPRPFKCLDCKSAFRIHGHLAKHLRSKMHIMKLECLRKLPFGTYAEMEKSGVNLNDIDTTDCDTSLSSLQVMAQRLYKKESDLLNQWETNALSSNSTITSTDASNSSPKSNEASESSSDEGGKDHTTSFQSEIEYPCYLLNVCKSRKLEDFSTQNSMLSHTTLTNLGELKLHCFEEHCVESNTTSPFFCHNVPVSLKNVEDKVINKKNTPQLTIISRAAIKESP